MTLNTKVPARIAGYLRSAAPQSDSPETIGTESCPLRIPFTSQWYLLISIVKQPKGGFDLHPSCHTLARSRASGQERPCNGSLGQAAPGGFSRSPAHRARLRNRRIP